MTGTRTGIAGSGEIGPGPMLPTTGSRLAAARLRLGRSPTRGSGVPKGSRALMSCWPAGEASVMFCQPGCEARKRTACSCIARRSCRSSAGEAPSACSAAMAPPSSASTAVMTARVRSISPRRKVSRSCSTSATVTNTANAATGSSVLSASRKRWVRSFTGYAMPSPLEQHAGLAKGPHLVPRRDAEAGGALQEAERLRRRPARQPAARVPPQAVRGDRLPAARNSGDSPVGRTPRPCRRSRSPRASISATARRSPARAR